MKFVWNDLKAEITAIKHGVDFYEAESVFDDSNHVRRNDPIHSVVEKRESLIGTSYLGRVLFVSFMVRKEAVRLISARTASRQERRLYEQANSDSDEEEGAS